MEKSGFKKFLKSRNVTLIFVWLVIVVVFSIMNPSFLTFTNIKNILYATSLSGTLAVGIGCMLISGQPDLSAGAVGMMGGVVVAMLMAAGWGWVPALLVTLLFGAAAGAINAFFQLKFKITPFIQTLAMSSVWQGIGHIITDSQSISVANPVFQKLGVATLFAIPVPFVITIVLYLVYGIMLKKFRFGRTIYMIGGNRTAAELAGINISKMRLILCINCSTIAALGGAILAGRMHSATAGSVVGTEFEGIIASCLGGIAFSGGSGGMLGGFIGLMLMGFFNNGLTCIGLNSYWQVVSSGLLLIAALTVDFVNNNIRERNLKKVSHEHMAKSAQ